MVGSFIQVFVVLVIFFIILLRIKDVALSHDILFSLNLISDNASTENHTNSAVNLRTPPSRGEDKEVKERRRLSALADYRINAKEEVNDRKTSRGNIFTTLRTGMKAVFQGRKVSFHFSPPSMLCRHFDSSVLGQPSFKT